MQKPYSRTVTDLGNGCSGVSIPKGLLEHFDVDQGDEVAIDHDSDEGTFIVRLD